MRILLSLVIICTFGVISAVPASADTIQVFLQGGQSNCVGNAPSSGLPTELQSAQTDVMFYFGISSTQGGVSLKNSALTWVDLQPGTGYNFGPEILFGRTMADALASLSNKVAIIKYGHGGTGFVTGADNVWYGGGDATTTGDGNVYQAFQATVSSGLADLATAYPDADIEIAGMIWIQCEVDAQQEPDDYEADLTDFFEDVRLTYGADLPIVIAQLADTQTSGITSTERDTVKAAQANVAAADPLVSMVVTDGYSVKSDNIHFDAPSQISLGTEMANLMLEFMTVPSYNPIADTTAPSTDVIVSNPSSSTYSRCFDPSDNANHFRGQTFLMPATGVTAGQWSVDAITIQKSASQTFEADSELKLWVFEWNPNTDGNDDSEWISGDGDVDGDIFSGTGITNMLIDGDTAPLGTSEISSDTYVTFKFTEPLLMDENKAYAFSLQYFKGSSVNTYFQFAVYGSSVYADGGLLQGKWDSQQIAGQDFEFYVQGEAISNCVNPPVSDISGPDDVKDCKVDIYDLAALAAGWLDCGLEPVELCGQ